MIEPTKVLPKTLQTEFQTIASFLYDDLEQNKSVIKLVDAPNPKHSNHKIRVVETRPPVWYSIVYHEIQDGRHRKKQLGKIRQLILKALCRIKEGTDRKQYRNRNGKYSNDERCRKLIKEMLVEGYEWQGYEVPCNEEAVNYFKGNEYFIDRCFINNRYRCNNSSFFL